MLLGIPAGKQMKKKYTTKKTIILEFNFIYKPMFQTLLFLKSFLFIANVYLDSHSF
jgi:hypothetical protein